MLLSELVYNSNETISCLAHLGRHQTVKREVLSSNPRGTTNQETEVKHSVSCKAPNLDKL